MKTNIDHPELKNRAELSRTTQTAGNRTRETLLPVDRLCRRRNRRLKTVAVLNLLAGVMPETYRLAEVVGRWVWVQFADAPAAEVRQRLSQIGFHWNRQRQAWQHPCGRFSLATTQDPREWYGSYFPARGTVA